MKCITFQVAIYIFSEMKRANVDRDYLEVVNLSRYIPGIPHDRKKQLIAYHGASTAALLGRRTVYTI